MVLPARSLLFVPANRPDRYAKAAAAGADKVIIDLEDSVPAGQRAAARGMIAPALPEVARERLLVRVNPIADPDHAADLAAVPLAAVGGLMVPKVEHAAELRDLASGLERRETAAGLAAGSTFLVVLIETARGVRDADVLMEAAASLGRDCVAAFGALDYGVEVGTEPAWPLRDTEGDVSRRTGIVGRRGFSDQASGVEPELLYPRARLTVAAAAAGLEPPLDSPSTHLRDPDRVRAEALAARRLGFQGKLCVHPLQVAACNEVFTPPPAAVAEARAVVDAYDAAQAAGRGAVALDGRMIDMPVVRRAQRTLTLARRLQQEGRSAGNA
ncbi:MAG: CoA ester lyase [Spirochaetaceae bacterium]|nr:CoA ester lyase [Spirochaetaceae bacterium]